MNTKTALSGFGILAAAAVCLMLVLNGCKSKIYGNDEAKAFLDEVDELVKSDLDSDSILLYVDYSTCVAEAMNSKFFQEVQPTIVSNTPIYYSIKGNTIAREYGEAYNLLRGVKEVNNADLKSAAEQIAAQNRQAVLITDAEYWHPGVGDNLNNPYMKESIAKWLNAGRDIYIYAEPYLESGKFNKKRYYIVFTDDRLKPEVNINKKMEKGISSLGDVKRLHLTANAPRVNEIAVEDPDGIMLYDKDTSRDNFRRGYGIEVFENNLSEIAASLKGAGENKKGDPIDLPFVAGIPYAQGSDEIFKITDIDVRVYDLTNHALNFADVQTDENGDTIPNQVNINLRDAYMDDVFEVDEDALEQGLITLYFDDEFVERDEKLEGPNLLRVDVVAKKAEKLFDKDQAPYEMLSWDSISKQANGSRNNSFFESVKQAIINNASIDPTAEGRNIIFTFYILTQQ